MYILGHRDRSRNPDQPSVQRHRQHIPRVRAVAHNLDVRQQQVDPGQGQQVGHAREDEQRVVAEASGQDEAGDLDDGHAADVAADLISQAEHDVIAAAVLVTDSPELALAVEAELKVRVAATKHADRIKSALSGVQSAIALVDDMQQGLDVVNAYAAEHLEIQTRNSRSDADKIRNAGAVFIGRFSPVSLGDYSAGSNHVLPTGGCACHSSGLSVQTFLRGLHFIEYDQKAFTDIVDTVVTLANSEDLPAHGEAMTARLENL